MAGDLVADDDEVHARTVRDQAREVLGFWFEMLMPEQHFAQSDSVDDAIRDRFGALRDHVLATEAAEWRDDPEALLAAIILLDQFSRNIHRGSAEAYAADPLAQELARIELDRNWDKALPPERRAFAYMPFMHAEDPALQALSVECFSQPEVAKNLSYAREHAEVIARFGRFPTRNAALGRESTEAEREFLKNDAPGW